MDAARISLPTDGFDSEPESEDPDAPPPDAIPELCVTLAACQKAGDRKCVSRTLKFIRLSVKHYRDRTLPFLLASGAFHLVAYLLSVCPIRRIQIRALRTIFTFQRYLPDAAAVELSDLGLVDRTLALLAANPNPQLIGFTTFVLVSLYGFLDDAPREYFRALFPIAEIARLLIDVVWDRALKVAEAARVNATIAPLQLLSAYVARGVNVEEFQIVGAVVHRFLFYVDGKMRQYGPAETLLTLLLERLNNLIINSSLDPALFEDAKFAAFVNAELENGAAPSRVLACEIWENLIRCGASGHGIVLNSLLDVIDIQSGRAAHAALALMATMLRESADRAELVAALVSAHPTEKGFQTFLAKRVWARDFECRRGCAMCMALMAQGCGAQEMMELARPKVVRNLVPFLELEDEEAMLAVLTALDSIFTFAQSAGEELWADVLNAWLQADGPERILEITQEFDAPEFAAFADRFCAMLGDEVE
jgi:hypothetical protein